MAPHRSTELTGEVRQTVIVTSERHQAPLVECPRLSSLNNINIPYIYILIKSTFRMQTGFNVSPICRTKPGESPARFLLIANILQVSVWVEGKMVH